MDRISRQRYSSACTQLVAWLSSPISDDDLDDLLAFLAIGAKRVNRRLPLWVRSLKPRTVKLGARRPGGNIEAEFVTAARAAWSAFCRLAAVAAQLTWMYSRAAALAVARALFAAFAAASAKAAPHCSRVALAARSHLAWFSRPIAIPPLRRHKEYALRAAEVVLTVAAVATLSYCAYVYTSAARYQAREKTPFSSLVAKEPVRRAPVAAAGVGMTAAAPIPRQALGTLEIPRIGLMSLVEQGDDSKVLSRSVGHIPGTALPGSNGNVGLAGHRDSFFRDLGQLVPGDEIVFHMTSITYLYRVRSASIVDPTDVAVLEPTGKPILTLVTCYPFDYIGSAPRRFILVADQITSRVTR
jgi:sortase A